MKLGKKITLNLEQLFFYTFSSLLIVMIAVLCLKLSVNTITIFPKKNSIVIKLNKSLAVANSSIGSSNSSALLSTPYSHEIVLNQVIDRQVYTPNKRKERASSIKKNLSLAKFRIVTA